jgi:hypothetical protein
MKEVALVFEPRPAASSQPRQGQEMPATSVQSSIGFWQRLLAQVRSWFEIPYGYEDENGFHYGHEPAPQLLAAPSADWPKVFTDRACDARMSPSPAQQTTVEAPDPEHRPTLERD